MIFAVGIALFAVTATYFLLAYKRLAPNGTCQAKTWRAESCNRFYLNFRYSKGLSL